MDERPQDWVIDRLMTSDSVTPGKLLEDVMADEHCVVFGPIHHFIVGAVLLTCWRNAEGSPDRDSLLLADLEELVSRSGSVPGAACARWGVCGAAASAGMAYAILRGNAPLRDKGWREGQLMVSELLAAIARSGSPRCCKRDTRVSIRNAIRHFNALGSPKLAEWEETPTCTSFSLNTVCMGEKCPYYPGHES